MELDVIDLGRMNYLPCVDLQRKCVEEVANGSRKSTLFYVEHPPVLTLGASFHAENLLSPILEYQSRGIEVVRTDRGGDVTYHGPGQLVIYPIFNLGEVGKDLHKWLRNLEETMLVTLQSFDIEGRRFLPHTGAWVDDRKIAAIGIKVRRWVSMHGIALNCNNDLAPFGSIIPCGISGYGVTSLTEVMGVDIGVNEVKPIVTKAFQSVFTVAE